MADNLLARLPLLAATLDNLERSAQGAAAATGNPTWAAGDGTGAGADEVFATHGLHSPDRCSEHPPGTANNCDDLLILEADRDHVHPVQALTGFVALMDPFAVLRLVVAVREILAYYARVLASRKEHNEDLGGAGALLALHGVLRNLADGFGVSTIEEKQ